MTAAIDKMLHEAKLANDISKVELNVHLLKPGMALRFYAIQALGFTPPTRKYLYSREARKQKYAPFLTRTDKGWEPTILMKDHCAEVVSWKEAISNEYKGCHTSEVSARKGVCFDKDGELSEVRVANSGHVSFTVGKYLPLDCHLVETKFVYCAFFNRRPPAGGFVVKKLRHPRLTVWKVPAEVLKKALESRVNEIRKNNKDVKAIKVDFSEPHIIRIVDSLISENEKKDNWNKYRSYIWPYYEQELDF